MISKVESGEHKHMPMNACIHTDTAVISFLFSFFFFFFLSGGASRLMKTGRVYTLLLCAFIIQVTNIHEKAILKLYYIKITEASIIILPSHILSVSYGGL
jgi:hypothetical protein